MKIRRIEKAAQALATALLVLLALGACQEKAQLPTTTIFTGSGEVELPLVTLLVDSGYSVESENIRNFLDTVPGSDRDFHVEIEVLPNTSSGEMRDQQLQRIRTAVMAGKGPDIFLTDAFVNVVVDAEIDQWGVAGKGPLFNFPAQAMENRLFLPLDNYIANARFMEFDELNPQIMALGRNQEGQQLLPMAFDFAVGTYVPSDYGLPEERPKNRQEMLDSGCPSLCFTAQGGWGRTLLDIFPEAIDQESGHPGFTEEELLEQAMEYWEQQHTDWGWGPGVFRFGADPSNGSGSISSYILDEPPGENAVLTPAYNQNHGVTAYVTMFAAINRNASYPDYAFAVLDKLMSRTEMNEQRIYRGIAAGLPVYTGAAGGEPVFTGCNPPQHLRAQYKELLELVDNVRFLTSVDQEMVRSLVPVCAGQNSTPQDVEKAVKEVYATMRMLLAES